MHITATNARIVDSENNIVWGSDLWFWLFFEFDFKRFGKDEGEVLELG